MNDGSLILHVHTPGADPRFSAGQRVGKGAWPLPLQLDGIGSFVRNFRIEFDPGYEYN